MKKWICIFVISILVITSCNQQKEKIIPRKQLVDMMVDLYICDVLEMNKYLCSQLGGIDSTEIYSTFNTKYNYNKNDLDYTLKYYSTKPKKLTLIYDQVFAELSKRADDMKNKYNNFSYPNLKNIWLYKGNIQIDKDTSSYPAGFDVPIDTTGTFLISVQIKLTDQDKSKNPYITAYFFNPQNDVKEERHYFKKSPIFKSEYNREYQIIEKNEDPALTHVFIIIPEQANSDSTFYKSLTLSNFSVSQILDKPDNEKLK